MELASAGVGAMLVCPGDVKTQFQTAVLGGRPPAKLAHNKRFASTAENVARAIADGIAADKRTVLTPAIGWGLVAAARLAPGVVDGQLLAMMESARDE